MKLINQYKGLNKEIYLLCLGRAVTASGSFIYPLLTMILNTKLGYSTSATASILAIIAIAQIPSTLVAGKLTDKFGRRKLILVFDTISILLFIFAGLMPLSDITIVVLTLASISQALEGPAYDSLIADFSKLEDRDRAYSLGYLAWNLGYIIGPAVGGLLFKDYLSLAFIINGLAILSSTFVVYKYIFDENAYQNKGEVSEFEKQDSASIFTVLKRNKIVFIFILVHAFSSAVYAAPGFILPIILPKLYENGSAIYGTAQSLNGLVVILFTPLLTSLYKNVYDMNKIIIGVAIYTSAMLIYLKADIIIFVYLAMAIYTIGEVSNTLGESPYLTKRIPASHRGRIITVLWLVHGTIYQLSNLFMGYMLEEYNYKLVFLIYFMIGLISVIIISIVKLFDRKYYRKVISGSYDN